MSYTGPSGHMTLKQRRLNVDATSWRCIDVEPTLYKRHVSAGVLYKFSIKFTDKVDPDQTPHTYPFSM